MIRVQYLHDTFDSKKGRIRLVDNASAWALIAIGVAKPYKPEIVAEVKAEIEPIAQSPIVKAKRGRQLKK